MVWQLVESNLMRINRSKTKKKLLHPWNKEMCNLANRDMLLRPKYLKSKRKKNKRMTIIGPPILTPKSAKDRPKEIESSRKKL